MKKIPYFLHLLSYDLLVVLILFDKSINTLFLIPATFLFLNFVIYQYVIDVHINTINKKKLKRIYILERLTSINAISGSIFLIMYAFSGYPSNQLATGIIAFLIVFHLLVTVRYNSIAESLYFILDDMKVERFDENAAKHMVSRYVLPYYLFLSVVIYYVYTLGWLNIAQLSLILVLVLVTIPFFMVGPKKAKKIIKNQKRYIYDDLVIPYKFAEPTKYALMLFLAMVAFGCLLYFEADNVYYEANALVVAVIALNSLMFSEYDAVINYYLNEKQTEEKNLA